MIFYTYVDRFDRKISGSKNAPKEVFTECGDPIGVTYEYRTKEGIKSLVPTGKVDRQSLIDSYADDCDIVKQIKKFIDGDTSVMNPSSGTYGDFTNLPSTYAELFDRLEQCKNVFESMPKEIKAKFDNSAESFWTQFGSERFDDIFKEFNGIKSENSDSIAEPINESEVKVDA